MKCRFSDSHLENIPVTIISSICEPPDISLKINLLLRVYHLKIRSSVAEISFESQFRLRAASGK